MLRKVISNKYVAGLDVDDDIHQATTFLHLLRNSQFLFVDYEVTINLINVNDNTAYKSVLRLQ